MQNPDDNAAAPAAAARYREARDASPATHLRWNLRGAGLENLSLDEVATPSIAPSELLVRHDACGICFSDVKIVNLGPDHPRLIGRDMRTRPVVMGHEVALTVMQVGADLTDRFTAGERYIVQADVYYRGANLAYGYALDGGMSQFGVIGKEVLRGDEGVYLLPLADGTGYAEAALIEPWACVVAAYRFEHRPGLVPGGSLLAMGYGVPVDPAELDAYIRASATSPPEVAVRLCVPSGGDVGPQLDSSVGGTNFTDIVLLGNPSAHDIEVAAGRLAKGGVLNLAVNQMPQGNVVLDIGRIHYDGLQIVGGETVGGLSGAAMHFSANRRAGLEPNGVALMIGAAGPMGQMHVQHALLSESAPRRIVVTDRHPDRLVRLTDRFERMGRQRGTELIAIDASVAAEPNLRDLLRAYGPFDDIVSMVPSPDVVSEALPHLAVGGVFNLFAGVARGTKSSVDLATLLARNQRIIGTSGSRIADLEATLAMVESGRLSTASSLAAIGGLEAFHDGLSAVNSGILPGKVVIFPHLRDLPLTPIADLKHKFPSVAARLTDSGRTWTGAAEQALFEILI